MGLPTSNNLIKKKNIPWPTSPRKRPTLINSAAIYTQIEHAELIYPNTYSTYKRLKSMEDAALKNKMSY